MPNLHPRWISEFVKPSRVEPGLKVRLAKDRGSAVPV
jgi:hypothetical protein